MAEEAAEITGAGWDWAGANLTKALPALFVVLHYMMVRIGEHLARTGETLRGLIGNPPKPGKMDADLLDKLPDGAGASLQLPQRLRTIHRHLMQCFSKLSP